MNSLNPIWPRVVWASCALLLSIASVSADTRPSDGHAPVDGPINAPVPVADGSAGPSGASAEMAGPAGPPAPPTEVDGPPAAPIRSSRWNTGVRVRARAALVVDMQSGEVVYQKNATSPFPVASITKLMTAVTYMGLNPDLEKQISITRQDVYRSNWTKLRFRERVSARDLLYATLVASDNAAARALARATGLTIEAFVEQMNETAASLGLANSRFTEPTGLDSGNTSTAVDCIALLWNALQDDLLAEILLAKEYRFGTNRRTHTIRTTNRLVREPVSESRWACVGSKTGYIRRAGYCLVLRAVGNDGDDLYAVILGGPTSRTRFTDMRRLLDWSVNTGRDAGPQAGVGG
ncbi:MAG: D-alanyl-D-alanine carboxypeptidase [Gemmatimonadetes bacterium]|nr:D-alanyl-D-alanine carboxypeptidase [Gemmatimonadota bacterium]MYG85169.1 D-alanyl-D-alanine carboxypeptidase [Gemmatimonadota bacterium]MYJ91284.1 D-alanyl-D-alanine carboxypeptidase [Gemmatimonadota bacterium]